jgi:SAM-dependent methyltransferase
MHSEISRFFSSHVAGFRRALADFEQRLEADEAPDNDLELAELARCITDSLDACAQMERQIADQPELLKGVQARYREAIWPWLGKSWFIQRSFSKPRGYPGDYFLLNSIYDRTIKSRGLGGYLDRYILDSTLGRAVVARLKAAREFLTSEVDARNGRARILNVACGPGREYVDGFLANEASDVEITLVDNDTVALDFVRENVAPHMAPQIQMNFQRYNALRMVSGKTNVAHFGRSDVIYSVGLCDYIPDDYLIPMLRGWRESLADGGVVYVAFKDQELYDKAVYQWLMDWYFYQRTFEDCRNLFVEAGYDMDQMEVTRSDMAVIVNFIGRSKSGAMVRFDDAESIAGSHFDEVAAPVADEALGAGS